jgi:hypothetical protein
MLRTREIHPLHADGDRTRRWLASKSTPPLPAGALAEALSVAPPSPNRRPTTASNASQQPTYDFCRQKRSGRQNVIGDRIRLATKVPVPLTASPWSRRFPISRHFVATARLPAQLASRCRSTVSALRRLFVAQIAIGDRIPKGDGIRRRQLVRLRPQRPDQRRRSPRASPYKPPVGRRLQRQRRHGADDIEGR